MPVIHMRMIMAAGTGTPMGTGIVMPMETSSASGSPRY